MDILKQVWEFIIKIFKFLWGKDIEYTPDEFYSDTRILKPEQIWLFLRRVLVLVLCYMVVSKTYAYLNMSWNNYKACRGKDICIIQGPDMHYPMYYPIVSDIIKDRYILVLSNQMAELYDIKRNKFKKLEKPPFRYDYTAGTFVFSDTNGNVLIKVANDSKSSSIFNIKTKKFEKFEISKFSNNFLNHVDKNIVRIYPIYGKIDNKRTILLHLNLEVFSYKTNDGNYVFVYPNATYFLKNEDNLVKTNEIFNKKNQQILSKLNDKSKSFYGTEVKNLSYIQISDSKILFFKGYNDLTSVSNNNRKKTFGYDIESDKFFEGPDFYFAPVSSSKKSFQKLAENKWIFFGGGPTYNSPKKYTQILIVKNRK